MWHNSDIRKKREKWKEEKIVNIIPDLILD
jgi:hypothetical protein